MEDSLCAGSSSAFKLLNLFFKKKKHTRPQTSGSLTLRVLNDVQSFFLSAGTGPFTDVAFLFLFRRTSPLLNVCGQIRAWRRGGGGRGRGCWRLPVPHRGVWHAQQRMIGFDLKPGVSPSVHLQGATFFSQRVASASANPAWRRGQSTGVTANSSFIFYERQFVSTEIKGLVNDCRTSDQQSTLWENILSCKVVDATRIKVHPQKAQDWQFFFILQKQTRLSTKNTIFTTI